MRSGFQNKIALVWGIGGVQLLLIQACWRLAHESRHAFASDWDGFHYVVFAAIVMFMAYSEGYKAFQKQFSPRVVSRAWTLLDNCTWLQFFFAPLFCMGFFHATTKRKIITYCVTLGIIFLIIGVRLLPHPWRGMVDVGVVIGLGWGLVAIVAFTIRALNDPAWSFPPDLPEEKAPSLSDF